MGMVLNLFIGKWKLSVSMVVNYLFCFECILVGWGYEKCYILLSYIW